ncbi:MAG: B12-binding domain-containing radical SAM protein [Acidobacteriota bacterium]|nr:B12-binding domain-containing radical SAM protein [Acidobacteriota bacterium]
MGLRRAPSKTVTEMIPKLQLPVIEDDQRRRRQRRGSGELRVIFVHTPMATYTVDERRMFWRNFDIRYHATHPGLQHMRRVLWELPHWMTWLAGVLVHAGYTNLGTLDFYSTECALSGVDRERVLQSLRNHPADVYLFSPMTPNLFFAYQIAELIKSLYPESKNVFGGVVATPLREEVAAHPSVDFVVHGRGEYALPHLLDAICGQEELGEVGNLCYRTASGEVVTTRHTYPWMPLDEIPFPKVDLFPQDVGLDLRYIRQVYGLGCPYECKFCTIQTIGRKPNYFPIERVLSEIRAYRAHYGTHHNIYFGDETFTANTERTKDLCDALEREGNVMYDCQTRLNLVKDANMLKSMERSGCRWVELGVEAVNQQTQNIFKQRVNLSPLNETLGRLRDEGLPVCSFLVNGFPNQTLDDMRRSVDFVGELVVKGLLQATYMFGLVPYPGSDIYHNPERYGMRLHHHDFRLYHEDMEPVFDTQYATAEEIYEVFLYGLRELGRAMGTAPYFGELLSGPEAETFGTFWESSHV